MKTITSYAWFSPGGVNSLIGMVITENEAGEEKAYIGYGYGIDQVQDLIHIAKTGAKFPLDAAELVIKEKGWISTIPY